MAIHHAKNIHDGHVSWRDVPLGRLLPLLGFVLFALLLTQVDESQQFVATVLLVAQIIVLVLGIRAWIPRRKP